MIHKHIYHGNSCKTGPNMKIFTCKRIPTGSNMKIFTSKQEYQQWIASMITQTYRHNLLTLIICQHPLVTLTPNYLRKHRPVCITLDLKWWVKFCVQYSCTCHQHYLSFRIKTANKVKTITAKDLTVHGLIIHPKPADTDAKLQGKTTQNLSVWWRRSCWYLCTLVCVKFAGNWVLSHNWSMPNDVCSPPLSSPSS